MTPLLQQWLRTGLVALLPLIATQAPAQVTPADCRPEQRGAATLVAIRPGFHTASGPLAGFDPCHRSVRLRTPPGPPAPLMISVHGGGGLHDVQASDEAFHAKGFATLVFDAYEMQRDLEGRGSLFWARQVTNEARQRMILRTAWEAYRWASQRSDVDTRRIFLFGVSNGAAVVANLAAMVDPQHVRGVIAEGITPIGLGLPDQVRVPLMLAFGRLDNFGAPREEMWRWMLTGPCRLNIRDDFAPPGTSVRCSDRIRPDAMMPTPLEWVEAIRGRSAPIEVAYFEDMAHNAYFGPLRLGRAVWGTGETFNNSLGATPAAREAFLAAMLAFVARHDGRLP